MKSGISRLLIAGGVAVLLTAGCNVDPQQAGQAAERVMTVAAQITPEAVETAMALASTSAAPADETLATPAPVSAAPVVYARCITRAATALLQLPQAGATEAASLSSRTIITAFGRTADATWVLGWNADEVRGWLPAKSVGCTAPMEDLRITDAGVLLTPTAAVMAEVVQDATAEVTAEMTATTMINAATATPAATQAPTATQAPAATATAARIPTRTASPSVTPVPTDAPRSTPAPTLSPVAATAAPATPARIITVVVTPTQTQVRDLRCEVTPGTPVNLRNGPARDARLLDTLPAGTRFLAQGRNEDAGWIYGFTERQMAGWLIASSVECDGNPAQLVEVDR
jgi:hypothetical protein